MEVGAAPDWDEHAETTMVSISIEPNRADFVADLAVADLARIKHLGECCDVVDW